jgi:hypothetical protein
MACVGERVRGRFVRGGVGSRRDGRVGTGALGTGALGTGALGTGARNAPLPAGGTHALRACYAFTSTCSS